MNETLIRSISCANAGSRRNIPMPMEAGLLPEEEVSERERAAKINIRRRQGVHGMIVKRFPVAGRVLHAVAGIKGSMSSVPKEFFVRKCCTLFCHGGSFGKVGGKDCFLIARTG